MSDKQNHVTGTSALATGTSALATGTTPTPRHPIVQQWLNGDNDAGGCIAELELAIAATESARDVWQRQYEERDAELAAANAKLAGVVEQMPNELFRLIESTLQYYGQFSEARMGDRTGGVVEGCPRGRPYIDHGEYADKAQVALQEWAKKNRELYASPQPDEKADAERYRWLRNNVTWFDPRNHVAPVLGPVSERIFYHASSFKVETLDAAIDAARAGKQERTR